MSQVLVVQKCYGKFKCNHQATVNQLLRDSLWTTVENLIFHHKLSCIRTCERANLIGVAYLSVFLDFKWSEQMVCEEMADLEYKKCHLVVLCLSLHSKELTIIVTSAVPGCSNLPVCIQLCQSFS